MALPRARWEHFTLSFDHGSLTATTAVKLYKAPRRVRILQAEYINPTGLVAHDDNWFILTLENGASVMFTRSTDGNGGGSSIAANTFEAQTLSSDALCTLAEGDVLSFTATEGGTATLPVGRLVLHCRYV